MLATQPHAAQWTGDNRATGGERKWEFRAGAAKVTPSASDSPERVIVCP